MIMNLRKEVCSVALIKDDEVLLVCRWWENIPFLGLPTGILGEFEGIYRCALSLAGLYLVNPPKKTIILPSRFSHPLSKEEFMWGGQLATLHLVLAVVGDAKETPKHNGEWRKMDNIKPWPDVTVDCLLASQDFQDFQKAFSQTRALVAA